ncbi:hypothetical protein [Clostridium sp.]
MDNTANSIKSYSFDEKGRGFEINFRKTKDAKGYWKYSDGNIDDYSYLNVCMDIKPVSTKISYAKNVSSENEIPSVEGTKPKTLNQGFQYLKQVQYWISLLL